MMNTKTYDGGRLRTILDDQGRRQTWLAERVGVSVGMINHICHGRKPLTAAMADKVAAALDVSPSLFLAADIHDGIETCTEGKAA